MDASQESGGVVVSGYALREVATSVRVSCCRRALFEGLIGDGFVLPCSSICRHQRRVNDAPVAPREMFVSLDANGCVGQSKPCCVS